MRPRNTRKALAELTRICRANGVELVIERGRGKGSHQALLFIDRKRNRSVRIVIAGGDEISPGVQRGMLSYLGSLGKRVARAEAVGELADAVRNILEAYFKT